MFKRAAHRAGRGTATPWLAGRAPAIVVVIALASLAGCSSGSGSSAISTTRSQATVPATRSSSPAEAPTSAASGGIAGRVTAAPWDRPIDQDLRVRAAGLTLTPTEQVAVHYHAHLDVIVDGVAIPVPAELGINVGPNDTAPPHGSPGIAPLHTHDVSGVLHIEAPAAAEFTLGQLFTEWNVTLRSGQIGGYRTGDAASDRVRVFVNGVAATADPAKIVLTAHEEIAVVVDSATQPAAEIPSSYAFPAGY